MKFKKEIIAIMLIICMLFTISAISAADSGGNTVGVANDTVEATAQDYSMRSNDDVEILNTGNDNALYDLQQTLNSATDGSTVVLDRDYEYDMMYDYETKDDGVTINKNLTIDGQNHKIDGKNESAIFLVKKGLHVTFKNIVFMNGKASYGGGAIYSSSQVVGNVINCTFIKNTNLATNYGGGAINVRSNNWNIINSTFINNTDSSNYGGGAIYAISGIFNIVNTEFINSSGKYGGAIFTYNSRTQIYSSTFEKNTGNYGGAIYAWSAVTQIYSSTFENNDAASGGTIYAYQSTINSSNDSKFINNDATYGGAIYASSGAVLNGMDSNFINNSAGYYGGAIYASNGAVLNYIDSNFINNSADYGGGAIYSDSNLNIANSRIINSSVKTGSGGAIYTKGENNQIISSVFINNTLSSSYNGGAIYSDSGTLSITTCTFKNNSANNNGGAIYAYESNITANADSRFINNSAKLGGAIYSHRANIQINNATFVKNKASSSGGAICGYYSPNDDLGNITNSIFINNTAASDGGAIYNGPNNKAASVDRCIFINNTATGQNSYGSAVYGASEIINSIFLNHEDNCIYKKSGTELALSNNWFGNTVDNFDESPIILSNNPIDNWYYFDVQNKGKHMTWSLKLYDRLTGQSSVVEDYNLPNITFSLSQENLTIASSKMQMNKTGQYGMDYTLEADTGLIAVQYETFKYILDVREGEFDALQELINSASANDEIKLTRNYTYVIHIDSIVDGIVIDKPGLTIDGDGFTIDAKDQSRIFNVTENAQGVTIKNVILTNGHASEGSVIYCTGDNLDVHDSILMNNGDDQIRATDSATIKDNWFGNTRDDFSAVKGVEPSAALKSWYYLDIDDETANHAIVELKLYNATTKQSSINANYNLPDITFKLSKDNLNFDETEITLDSSGQYDVEYTSGSGKGSITAEYDTSKYKKVIGETDFERLQRYVNEAGEGDVIELYENFTYQTGDSQIVITTKRLTIDGHGYTIDAKNQINIIYTYYADGLTFKNITFANAKSSYSGAAISSYSNMNVINCTFVNATASSGGFIWFAVKSNVIGCTFINGTSTVDDYWDGGSGAIHLSKWTDSATSAGSTISNSTFINCTAIRGGAMRVNYKAIISNCTFINGKATDGAGIHMNGKDSIIFNCTFINGTAGWGGGAIRSECAHSVINCTFINNSAPNQIGGALQGYSPNMYICNCTFINNTSPRGGAIWNDKENLTVINCTFNHNIATTSYWEDDYGGGAIWHENENFTVINSTFTNNVAIKYGAAILRKGANSLVDNCTFINNTADRGSAIQSLGNNFTVISSKVINNTATTQGGAINAPSGDGLYVNDSTFINISSDWGAVIYSNVPNSLISNCTFIKNSLTGASALILFYKENSSVNKSLFIENTVNKNGGGKIIEGQSDTVVSNSIFLDNEGKLFYGSLTANYNWYGNTADNYDQQIYNTYSAVINNWLFVNATFDRQMKSTDENQGEFVFQLYENGGVSDYDSSKVHEVNMTISSENGDVDRATAVMGDEITFTPTQSGTGKVTASFFRNLGVTDQSLDITFDISKTPTEIILDETSITVFAHHNILDEISPVVTPDVDGTFAYSTDDSTIINVTDPQFISGLKAGTAQLTITFTPTSDDFYEPSDIVVDVTVTRDTSGITADSITFDYGDEARDIEVTLTPEYLNNLYQAGSASLTFISANTSVFTVNANGRITPQNAGKANLTIKFEQTDDYLASEKNVTVTVNKVDSELVLANDIVFDYLSSNTTTFTVDGGSVELANIKVIGHDEAVIDLTGNVITVSNLNAGTYTLNVTTTPDANHKAVSKTKGITVNRIAPTITIQNGETANVNVKSSITINANVDSGADLTYTPNETGIVSLDGADVTGLKAGKVNITVSVPQTVNYLAGSKNITITVNRIDAGIHADNINVDVNSQEQIVVIGPDDDDYDGEITFESKTPAVATVDENTGLVTGETGGTAIVTISWTQTDLYKADSYDVTVTVNKIEAVITAEPLTVNVSETKCLKVNAPDDFDGTIVYTPQNPLNVTVDSEGNVTGLRGGDVVVTLTWAESPKYLGCSTTVIVTVNKINPTITIEKGETASVDAGSTLDIGATGSGTLTFASNNTNVATVDGNGVVTGVIGGKVNITVYSAENDQYLAGNKNITVTVNKIAAKINASEIDVDVRDTNSLVVQKPDDYPAGEITFESQNNEIAYVGQDGVVSGHKGGDVVITISWEETEKYLSGSYNVNVHVKKLPANLQAPDLEVEYDHSKQLVVTRDSNGALSYEITDVTIATFENGNVNGLKIGETTLTINISETDEYLPDSISVPVKVVRTSPNLQAQSVLLHVGNTEPIVVTHLGDGALSYEITDTGIATVDADGKVTGVSEGTTTLKISIAQSENYTSQEIEVNVVVTNKQIGHIIISGSQEYSVDVDGTILINATTDSDGTLSYSVNDPSVATLTGDELIGIKGGEVEVTITLPETSEYSGLSESITIKVNKLTPVITIDNGDSDVVDVDGNLIISAHTTSETGYITYASNDTIVATVDSVGNVTGKIGGKVNITVKSVETDKYKESTKNIIVTVNKLTPTITVNNGNPVSVDVKSTVNINATKGDSDGVLKYVSGNESRAVIDTRGNIRGVTGYPVVITVSVTETQRYRSGSVDVIVQVNKINPVITINNAEPVSVDADDSFVIDARANGAVLSYGSCNASIAQVDSNGVVTGIIGGVVNITVYAAETDEYLAGSKNLTVTVNKLTPEITIDNGDSDVVDVDANLNIVAHTTSGGAIAYASNDTAVATVDSTGVVTGVTGGVVNITVKSVENAKYKELTKNITVTVNKLTPTITVNGGNPVSVDVKSTVSINATTDSDGALEYASADEGIAVIDNKGNITGVTGYSVAVTVSVPETQRYYAGSVDVTVQVNKIDPVITINNVEPVSVDAEDSFVIDASANGAVLSYGSCNDSIAQVDSNGVVTGIVGGVVNITVYAAETDEYLDGSKNLTVTVNKIDAVITPESLVLDVFDTKHLNVIKPDDFKGTIVYTPQNPDNVTVDGEGNVTGLKGGDVVITLSWAETDKYLEGSTTAIVTVNKINPVITIENGESASVRIDKTLRIRASANGADLTYESNDSSVASVDSTGVVTGVKYGVANITVYAAETDEYLAGSKNITINVNKNPTTLRIGNGDSSIDVFKWLALEIVPLQHDREYVFESSDPSIAYVSQSGYVYGRDGGKANITVTALENEKYLEKSATIEITVNRITPEIVLDVANITVGEVENVYITVPEAGKVYIALLKDSKVLYSGIETLNSYLKYSNSDLGVGNYTITVKYYGSSRYTEYTVSNDFIVRPIYKYEFEAEVEDTIIGQEANVTVTLPADAKGVIKIGDEECEITGEKTLITLPVQTKAGKNNVTVEYIASEDSKYDSSKITASYYVFKKESTIIIDLPSEIKACEPLEINISSNSGVDVDVYVDGVKQTVNDGKVTVTPNAGTHTVIASVAETDEYLSGMSNKIFTASKSTPTIAVSGLDIVEGQSTTITITTDLDEGIVVVNVNDTEIAVDLSKEKSADVKLDVAGTYQLSATYLENDKYNSAEAVKSTIIVSQKLTPEINIITPEIKYAEVGIIEISIQNATGEVQVIVDGVGDTVKLDDEGYAKYTISEMNAGDHSVVVIYSGDDNHYADSAEASFEVAKADVILDVTAADVAYGENVIVNVTGDVDGEYTVTVNDVTKDVAIAAGETVSVDFGVLKAGNYEVTAAFAGDNNYNAASVDVNVKVNRAIPEITVVSDAVDYGEALVVNVVLPDDVTRRPVVTIGNESKTVSLKKGTGTAKFTGLAAGTYNIAVSYSGDGNYAKASANAIAKVNRITPEIIVVAEDIGYGDDLLVNVTLPDDVTRRAVVSVGNESKTVILTNGRGSAKFSGLAIGSYNVIASYNGDNNYVKSSVFATVKVDRATPEIIIAANPINAGEDLIVNITMPSDVTRRASVTIGNESKFVILTNGFGSVKFSGLTVGTYDITATYNGDAIYAKASASAKVKVNRGPAAIDVVASPVSYGETAVVDITLPSDVTRRATVTIDGNVTKTVILKNGIGSAEFAGLSVGTHNVVVAYNGDANYLKSSVNATLKVNKAIPEIKVTANSITAGEPAVIEVQLPADVAKRAIVTIDGVQKYVTLKSGAGSVKFTGLTAGIHDITVSYPGDANYKKTSVQSSIVVE